MARLMLANQATAARRRAYFDARDATDGITAEVGEALGQPQISTNGGAFTNVGIGTLTAIGTGRYYADLTQAAVATAGTLIETRYKSAATAESPGDSIQVVAFDPDDTVRLGLTALPSAAANAAGGLPVSIAGALNLDTQLAATNEVTAARMGALTDWINGGRLDLIIDSLLARLGVPTDFGSGVLTLAANLQDLADDGTAIYSRATDSLQAIRDRGDAAWTTGAGGSDRLLLVDTTIATLASQTSFTLAAGSADNNAYNNCTIVIEDVVTATQKALGMVLSYTGATKTVTLKEALAYTIAATDKVYILAENSLKSTVANRQLDVTATGAAGIDWANVENPATAVDLAATAIQLADTITTYTGNTLQTGDVITAINDLANATDGLTALKALLDAIPTTAMRGTDSAALASEVTAARMSELDAVTAGKMANQVDEIRTDTGVIGTAGAGLSDITINQASVNAIWDEVLTKALHNVNKSAGKRLRKIDAAFEVHSGTAQGGTASTIQFDTGASAVDNIYNGDRVIIVDGTGVSEHGIIISYVGATFTATMSENWVVTPDFTSEFEIIPASVDVATVKHSTQTAGDIPALINGLADVTAAQVLTQVNTALDTAIPGSPTANSINQRVAAVDDLTQAAGARLSRCNRTPITSRRGCRRR